MRKNELMKLATQLMKEQLGDNDFEIKRVTLKGTTLTVRYTEMLAAFAYYFNPDLNDRPTVYTATFEVAVKV